MHRSPFGLNSPTSAHVRVLSRSPQVARFFHFSKRPSLMCFLLLFNNSKGIFRDTPRTHEYLYMYYVLRARHFLKNTMAYNVRTKRVVPRDES